MHGDELTNSESFFRRMFKDKVESDEKLGTKIGEDEGFLKRLFRDKGDDRDKKDKDDKEKLEEELPTADEEETSVFSLFRRFLRVHPEEGDKTGLVFTEMGTQNASLSSQGTEGFFKRLFKDRSLEDSKFFNLRREDGMSPSSILKKLFKDRSDDSGSAIAEDHVKGSSFGSHKETFKDTQLTVKNELHSIDSWLAEASNGCVLADLNLEQDLHPFSDHNSAELGARTPNVSSIDSGFPCFKGGVKTIQNLRKRFHLSLTEEQCVTRALSHQQQSGCAENAAVRLLSACLKWHSIVWMGVVLQSFNICSP